MSGKIAEKLYYQQIFTPLSITASTVLYNGVAATTTSAIDTQGYDELNVILNMGVAAAGAVVDVALYESASTDPSASTAITGADFTQITASADSGMQVASILTKNTKRYIWLQTSKTDVGGAAAVIAATAVLGKADTEPTTNTLVFDVE